MSVFAASLLLILSAYLIGSASGSLLLGRLRGVDIREHGSGNAGGTNAFRTQGWRFALGAVLVDVGKGALAAWIAMRLGVASPALSLPALAYLCALAAVIGHVWPLWHGFRGGKGVATLLGALVLVWPAALPWLLLVWLLVLVAGGYVGLASVLAVACLLPLALLGESDPARVAFACATLVLVVFTHRGNLQRLRSGNELRFDRARIWRRRA